MHAFGIFRQKKRTREIGGGQEALYSYNDYRKFAGVRYAMLGVQKRSIGVKGCNYTMCY